MKSKKSSSILFQIRRFLIPEYFLFEDFSLFLKKVALLTFVPSALNIFLQLGMTNHLVMDFSTSVWLFLVSLACDAIRLRKGQTAVK